MNIGASHASRENEGHKEVPWGMERQKIRIFSAEGSLGSVSWHS